jgi:ATP-binding cassette, subfamily B, bacterial
MKKETLHLRSICRHFWPFVRMYPVKQLLIFISYGIGSLLSAIAVPLIYKEIVDAIAEGGVQTGETLITLIWYLVGITLLYNILYRVGDYCIIQAQSGALKHLTDYALAGLANKSYRFYSNTFTGGLVAKVKRFVRSFEELHGQIVYHLWMQGLALVSAVGVLWYHSWHLGLFFLVWLVCYGFLVYGMVRWTIPKTLANAEADSKVTAHLSDILANILTVKMFGASKREHSSFAETTTYQLGATRRAWMQNGFWNSAFQGITINIFEIGIIVGVVMLWMQGSASAGLMTLVLLYVLRSFNIVWQISRNVLNITRALTDANEMVEILDEPAEVEDAQNPEEVRFTHGRIAFAHVRHAYDGGAHVFKDLSLEIQSGEKVALVGHSGAGKSTIVKLLLRFLDVEGGSIEIDGQDITKVRQEALRQKIAYVPQEPSLFHRTLFENIAYGKVNATREEVEEASRRARAHDFIVKTPSGYDTLVGERGVKLSGGERQRVAIARALLKDAPIVILDEATSSLDSISERFIQEAFDELMKGRTTIVIAHRLSTIQHMDRIVVLEDGAVAEEGTHSALLAQGGIYANLWQSQVGGFLPDDTPRE